MKWQPALARVVSLVVDPTVVLSFSHPGYVLHSWAFDPTDLDVDLRERRCVISGANQGIGYEAALALARLGAEVVLLCRSPERGAEAVSAIRRETGNDRVELVVVDMSDLDAIRTVAPRLTARPIDVLIHNAGLLPTECTRSAQGLEITMATHVVGPHLLTRLLLPALGRGSRIVWVSSGGMYSQKLSLDDWNWEKRPYDGVVAYAQTKRMQVVASELWADRLSTRGIAVNAMHPGWADTSGVRTSIPRFHEWTQSILRSPAEGADTIVWLAASPAAARWRGHFFLDRQPRSTHYLPFTRERSIDRHDLWHLCEELAERSAGSR